MTVNTPRQEIIQQMQGAVFSFQRDEKESITLTATAKGASNPVIHDAEYYRLDAQNNERWAAEDKELGARLAELKKKHGKPPNIIYILWNDMTFGAVGFPLYRRILALQYLISTRWPERISTSPECTPSHHALPLVQHF